VLNAKLGQPDDQPRSSRVVHPKRRNVLQRFAGLRE
jgi:hypothetical protein